MILNTHEVRTRWIRIHLFAWPAESKGNRKKNITHKTINSLSRWEERSVLDQKHWENYSDKRKGTVISHYLYYVLLRVFTFSHHLTHISQLRDCKACSITCITIVYSQSNICLSNGHQVISPITCHSYFMFSVPKELFYPWKFVPFLRYLLFKFSDNESFILWWDSGENFNGFWNLRWRL